MILVTLAVVVAVWLAPMLVAFFVSSFQGRQIADLRRRITELEAEGVARALSRFVSQPVAPPAEGRQQPPEPAAEPTHPAQLAASDLPDLDAPEPLPSEPPRPVARPTRPEPDRFPTFKPPSPERVVVWIAAAFGGLAVVLTALLALVAVVEKGWLGPAARVSMGLAGGTALWVGGSWARRQWPWVGSALTGAGIGTLYGALFAASGRYGLVPSSLAGGAMVAVTLLGTLRASADRDRFVGWLSLAGGLMTPWLISTGENRPIQLFLYLGLLASGIVAASARRGWWDLIVGTAVGVCGIHLTWTESWYTADQVPAALLGVALLSLPFAAAAALAPEGRSRWAAIGSAATLPLLALPWIVPVDPMFYDPRSGLAILREQPLALPFAVVAVCTMPWPLIAAARFTRDARATATATLPALFGLLTFAGGWSRAAEVDPKWLLLGILGGTIGAVIATARDDASTRIVLGWFVGVGLALTTAGHALGGSLLGIGVLTLSATALVAGVVSRIGWTAPALLFATAAALFAGAATPEPQPERVLGPALLALFVFGLAPVMHRWKEAEKWAWASAAAAPLVSFPLLYRVWVDRAGDGAIGLLPVVLAATALLAGTVLVRRARLLTSDFVVAAFTAVVLLGIAAAIPLQLRERWLTVAWSLEAAGLAAAALRVRHPLVRWTSVVLCTIVGVRLLFNPWALAWGDAGDGLPILNWTLYTWGIPALCIGLSARWLSQSATDTVVLRRFVLPLGILALLVGFALINVEVSHAFQDVGPLELVGGDRLQSMVRSASWAMYGLVILGAGLWRDHRVVRLVGFAFVLLATFKVFGVDLWDLEGFVRVGSMGCLAIALILAAFAFERLVLRSTQRPVESTDPGEVA